MKSSAPSRRRVRRAPSRRGPALGHLDLDREEERLYAMTPLDAELLGSAIIAENYWARDPGTRGDPARLEILLAAHAGGDRPFNLAILLMVAAVGDPAFRERTLEAVATLPPELPRPPWAEQVGEARILGAWRTRDNWLELVTLSFAYPVGQPAAATAVVDREPTPLITHTMVEPSIGPALERLEKNPNGKTDSIPVSEAVDELRAAMVDVDSMFDPPITHDFASDRAFLAALLRRAVVTLPDPGR